MTRYAALLLILGVLPGCPPNNGVLPSLDDDDVADDDDAELTPPLPSPSNSAI